jgi:enoyl-CoA hydratase/carnithine racemase
LNNKKPINLQPIILEKEPPLAWIKLNRPEAANSLNTALLKQLIEVCEELTADTEIRVVCVIGSGVKVFSAGADLAEREQLTPYETIDYIGLIQRSFLAVENLPQPVIACINGSAYGGGTELALACDLRVMDANATLRLTEVRLGIIPGAGGTQRLPRLIGKTKAKEMIYFAAPLTAQEGLNLGLINKVVETKPEADSPYHEPLIKEVREWAKEMALAAPLSLRQAKAAIDGGYDRDLLSGLAHETKAYLRLLNTKDRLEGLAAFAEKRQPNYVGE